MKAALNKFSYKIAFVMLLGTMLAGCFNKQNTETISQLAAQKPSLAAAIANDNRTNWLYTSGKGGEFKKDSNGNTWEEVTNNNSFWFVEKTRTDAYVEINDSTRNVTVRLYADRGEISIDGSSWFAWVSGNWKETATATASSVATSTDLPTVWIYSTGKLEKTADKLWQETAADGNIFTFAEKSRSASELVIYDNARKMYLRILSNYGQWSLNATSWNFWINGKWEEATSKAAANTANTPAKSTPAVTQPAVPLSERVHWDYTSAAKAGYFERVGDSKNWQEQTPSGKKFEFIEEESNEDFVRLVDSKRGVQIKLFNTRASYSGDGKAWVQLVNGQWAEKKSNPSVDNANPNVASPAPSVPATSTPAAPSATPTTSINSAPSTSAPTPATPATTQTTPSTASIPVASTPSSSVPSTSNPTNSNPLASNPTQSSKPVTTYAEWKVLVLIYPKTKFTFYDKQAKRHNFSAEMTEEEINLAKASSSKFFNSDLPLLASGYVKARPTIKVVDRVLDNLEAGCGYYPGPNVVAKDIDGSYDSVVVIWDGTGVNELTKQDDTPATCLGWTPYRGKNIPFTTFLVDGVTDIDRNVFKHEWGHAILFFYEASGKTDRPSIDNHLNSTTNSYVNCKTGKPYILEDETDSNPISNSVYNNNSGFTHDYYSGLTAHAANPSKCIGITADIWKYLPSVNATTSPQTSGLKK